ncbi:hypothetical protein [Microbulbifer guangxiensis]|uniref:hypothetical protein n=1 Tax=Microbulbifer guangxiensis TaxID=2904249 RepID=UPI001F36C7EA|nr:hypothetical protein [Microbulbifer guangxiensis]
MNKHHFSVGAGSLPRPLPVGIATAAFLAVPSLSFAHNPPDVDAGTVPMLWAASLLAALLVTLTIGVLLWLRLRQQVRSIAGRLAKLQSERDRLDGQLRHYGREIKERDKKLSEATRRVSELRQSKDDLQAVIGHQLRRPLENLRETLQRLTISAQGDSATLAERARSQLQPIVRSLDQIQRLGRVQTVAVASAPQAATTETIDVESLRVLNLQALERKRATLGHQPFADLINRHSAGLPKKITELTSALTGRHWLDAEKLALVIAANSEEIGLDAIAGHLRNLAAQLGIDSERERCRQQRTELLNLMRVSIQQLQEWKSSNLHTEWALR